MEKMHLDPALTAASFTRAQRWKQLGRPLTDGWINSGRNTVERYSVLKRKESLTQATEWMKLEVIVLSDISQTQKDKCCVTPLM